MKKSLIKTILLISMVLGYSSSWATNIIVNPIFEDGDLSPWYGWDITSADAHSALHSATVLGRFDKIRQDFSPILTDSINEISFWMRQPETAMSTITLFFADNSTTADVIYLATADWEFINITSWLTPGSILNGISFSGYEGAGNLEDRTYLDDVTIDVASAAAVPEPTTMLLFGSGLVFLAGIRNTRNIQGRIK